MQCKYYNHPIKQDSTKTGQFVTRVLEMKEIPCMWICHSLLTYYKLIPTNGSA